MNPTTPRLDAAPLAPSPRALPRNRGTLLPRSLLDATMGRSRVIIRPATPRREDTARGIREAEGGGAARTVVSATLLAPHDAYGARHGDFDPRLVTTRTMNDAAVEPTTGGGPRSRSATWAPRGAADSDLATKASRSRGMAGEGKVGRSGQFRGSNLVAGDKGQPRQSLPGSHRVPMRSLVLRWDDNADGDTPEHTDDVPSSSRHPSAALCRQYTDVSALTWDGETTVGTSAIDLRPHRAMSWLVRRRHRDGPAPMTGPNDGDAANRPTLGRRCIAELIEDDERNVGHMCAGEGTAATQPPKMPVRKISNRLGAQPRALDSHASSLPPTLPLRQATMTTVVTAESTAVASAANVTSTTRGVSPGHGVSVDCETLDMGTRVRFHLDTSETGDVHDAPIDDERSHPVRHCNSEEPALRASLTEAHPPVMPVRQASLLATSELSRISHPISHPESSTFHHGISAAAGASMLDRASDPEPQGLFVVCSTSPFAAPRSTERPPHPPTRKASA